MHIQWKDETQSAYFLMDEDGKEIHQSRVREEWLEEQQEGQPLEDIVLAHEAEKLALTPGIGTESPEVRVVKVEVKAHSHGKQYLTGLPKHSHKEHADAGHKHEVVQDPAIPALQEVQANDAALQALLIKDLGGRLDVHVHKEYAPVGYRSPETETQIAELYRLAKFLDQKIPTDIPEDHNEEFAGLIRQARTEIADLSARVDGIANDLRRMIVDTLKQIREELELLKHGHGDFLPRDEFDAHLNSVSKQANMVKLSEQEVAGKKRYVLEELA